MYARTLKAVALTLVFSMSNSLLASDSYFSRAKNALSSLKDTTAAWFKNGDRQQAFKRIPGVLFSGGLGAVLVYFCSKAIRAHERAVQIDFEKRKRGHLEEMMRRNPGMANDPVAMQQAIIKLVEMMDNNHAREDQQAEEKKDETTPDILDETRAIALEREILGITKERSKGSLTQAQLQLCKVGRALGWILIGVGGVGATQNIAQMAWPSFEKSSGQQKINRLQPIVDSPEEDSNALRLAVIKKAVENGHVRSSFPRLPSIYLRGILIEALHGVRGSDLANAKDAAKKESLSSEENSCIDAATTKDKLKDVLRDIITERQAAETEYTDQFSLSWIKTICDYVLGCRPLSRVLFATKSAWTGVSGTPQGKKDEDNDDIEGID